MIEAVLQLPHTNEHLDSLTRALRRGRGAGDFRAMVAFLRQGELTDRMWRAIDAFCRGGGRIDWIVGTDLGGTDGNSLRRLFRLQRRYPANRVRIMKLGGSAVFHPKFYWISLPGDQVALVGSANFTQGGLGGNLELSVKIEARGKQSDAVERMLRDVWSVIDRAKPPLTPADFYPLEPGIIERVAEFHARYRGAERQSPRHPLRHGGVMRQRRERRLPRRPRGPTLLMDLTLEQGPDRMTQVQPPRAIWERYFGVNLGNPGTLRVRNERGVQGYRHRSIVRHHHVWTLEIPEADVERPALMRFRRTGPRRYSYAVLTPQDRAFGAVDRLLETAENPWRRKPQERRWLVY